MLKGVAMEIFFASNTLDLLDSKKKLLLNIGVTDTHGHAFYAENIEVENIAKTNKEQYENIRTAAGMHLSDALIKRCEHGSALCLLKSKPETIYQQLCVWIDNMASKHGDDEIVFIGNFGDECYKNVFTMLEEKTYPRILIPMGIFALLRLPHDYDKLKEYVKKTYSGDLIIRGLMNNSNQNNALYLSQMMAMAYIHKKNDKQPREIYGEIGVNDVDDNVNM